MSVVDASFGHPLQSEEEASAPLAGGVMNQGYQCGMLWGASLAAGAEAYRRFGSGPRAEAAAIAAAQKLVETFRRRTKNEIDCREITETNLQEQTGFLPVVKFLAKGGKIGPGACFRLAAGYAPEAFETIDAALAEEPAETPASPLSCAAVLARKMGASDKHAVMASGFAGGIGLQGSACGALGAAIWLTAMNKRDDGASKIGYFKDPGYQAVVDQFKESTGGDFECRQIVGRTFASVEDHAAYVQQGGCAQLIERLATSAAS